MEASTTCRPAVEYDGRWFYDCDAFEGDNAILNPVSIVYTATSSTHNGVPTDQWQLKMNIDVQTYINNGDFTSHSDSGPVLDTQWIHDDSGSVCINHNGKGYDYEGGDGDTQFAWGGTLECLPEETSSDICDHEGAMSKLIGPGSFNCVKRQRTKGTVHICKVQCDEGYKIGRGKTVTRCKEFVKADKDIGTWNTSQDKPIRCVEK